MNCTYNEALYDHCFRTIDSHTMGEATRIIYDGFPELPGDTMMKKKDYLMEHYDHYRKALMMEPRGHRDMFGALLTEPVHPEADYGVIFMDTGGCRNMCGHGSIGTASMLVETGMVPVTEPYTEVVLDAPSGIIRTRVKVKNQKAEQVSILNVPAFLYKENLEIDIPGYGTIPYDISFGGSFFALVDAEKLNLDISMEDVDILTELGMLLLQKINETETIKHPYLDITTVDLVEFYSHTAKPDADMKNCVIFGMAQADRSPCGTGTSAKMAALYAKGELKLHTPFVYESVTGSLFTGEATREVDVNGYRGIIPQITGSAYITGMNTWILDQEDPLEMGFLLGTQKETPEESDRSRIVRAAWQLFHEKGYEATTIKDVVSHAGVSLEIFYKHFEKKDDLEYTLGDLFDRKYADLMVQINPRLSHYDTLLYLNQELFRMIETEVPFPLVKHLYMEDSDVRHNLMNKKRFYYSLIPQLIREGQEKGELRSGEDAKELADNYFSLERGIIYDWCVKEGKDSLTKRGQRLMQIFLKELV